MSYTYKQHTWIPREIISADKMNEYETLAEYVSTLKRVAETNSYNDLDNKPQINSHELTGNMTTAGIGLHSVAESGNYDELKNRPQINGNLLTGNKTTTQIGLHTVAESGSYNDLKNKPQINSHELTGNFTAAQLGFATVAMTGKFADLVDEPTKVSQFQNDLNYQTAAQVAASIANSSHLKRLIVTVLPDASAADLNTIYMLKVSNGVDNNSYAEYMVVEGKWEKLGTSDIDLTQYMKTTDIEKKLAEKVPITRKINGIALNADVTIPTASPTVNGTMKLYTATGSAVDGTMTQKLITDLLNGKMPKNGNVAGGTDFNTLTASGFYIRQGDDTHGNTNAPTNGNSHYHVLVLNFSADYIRQFAYDVRSSALWTRGLVNKNWTAWERIYTTGFKPGAGDAGAVPTTRKVNGKALSSDITLTATDVGAPTGSVHEDATNAYIQFEGFPTDSVVSRLDLVYAKSANKPWMHVFKRDGTNLSIDFVPATRKVNNKALSGDITLNAGDVGALASGATATAANKLATPRKINLSGDATANVSFDGSGDVTLTAMRRGCIVGQSNNMAGANTWYKFASIVMTATNDDADITFYVTSSFGKSSLLNGILTAHIRTSGSVAGAIASAELRWIVAGTSVNPNNFVLAYSTATPYTYELWVNASSSYEGYRFDVISEGNRTARQTNKWTLYNNYTAVGASSPTSGYTKINSTLNKISNTASYAVMTGATTSNAGTSGLVPVPSAGEVNRYLRSDGKWEVPPSAKLATTTEAGSMKLYTSTGSATDGTINQKVITEQLNAKVPTSRTVNNKALTGNIALTAADVGARPSTWTPTAANVGALPTAGGTMTGTIHSTASSVLTVAIGATAKRVLIATYGGDVNGMGVVFAGSTGGRTIIGGGEAGENLHNALGTSAANESAEQLHLCNDTDVYVHTNCQNIAQRKTFTFSANGSLSAPGGFTGKVNSLFGPSGLLHDLFPTQQNTYTWVPVFSTNWAGGGHMSLANLRSAMGLGNSTGVLAVGNGGTGANNAATARSNLGIPTIIYGSLPSAVTNGVLYLVPVQ